jgi:hypothetical protein
VTQISIAHDRRVARIDDGAYRPSRAMNDFLFGLTVALSVGPVALMIANHALRAGIASGVRAAAGVATADGCRGCRVHDRRDARAHARVASCAVSSGRRARVARNGRTHAVARAERPAPHARRRRAAAGHGRSRRCSSSRSRIR